MSFFTNSTKSTKRGGGNLKSDKYMLYMGEMKGFKGALPVKVSVQINAEVNSSSADVSEQYYSC